MEQEADCGEVSLAPLRHGGVGARTGPPWVCRVSLVAGLSAPKNLFTPGSRLRRRPPTSSTSLYTAYCSPFGRGCCAVLLGCCLRSVLQHPERAPRQTPRPALGPTRRMREPPLKIKIVLVTKVSRASAGNGYQVNAQRGRGSGVACLASVLDGRVWPTQHAIHRAQAVNRRKVGGRWSSPCVHGREAS